MLRLLKRVLLLSASGRDTRNAMVTVQLPFPFLVVHGGEALRERASRLGGDITPVLMGEQRDVELLCNLLEDAGEAPEHIIALSNELDVQTWLEERSQEDPDFYTAPSGRWPKEPPAAIELSMHLGVLSKRPKKSVILGLVPTVRSWEVPAYARFGGWNACPEPSAHVALHRAWNEKYGSEIACLSSDVIECTVSRPPATRDEAMRLAREQSIYCPDIVCQGVETVENLAATLMASRNWYFWWD